MITPALKKHGPVYMAGFGHNRVANGVHDDLYARCLAFSAGAKPWCCAASIPSDCFSMMSSGSCNGEEKDSRQEGADRSAAIRTWWWPRRTIMKARTPWACGARRRAIGNQRSLQQLRGGAHGAERPWTRSVTLTAGPRRRGAGAPSELDTFIDDDRPPVVHRCRRHRAARDHRRREPHRHPGELGQSSRDAGIEEYADHRGLPLLPMQRNWRGDGRHGGVPERRGGRDAVAFGREDQRPGHGAGPRRRIASERRRSSASSVAEQRGRAVAAKPFAADQVEFPEQLITIPVTNRGFQMAAQADLYKGRKKTTADGATTTSVGLVRMSGARQARCWKSRWCRARCIRS